LKQHFNASIVSSRRSSQKGSLLFDLVPSIEGRMRRRQQQAPFMTEPDINPEDPKDPEDPEDNCSEDEEDDRHPLMAAFDISSPHGDDDRKALSILPRNYNSRRRLLVAGACFIFVLILLQARNNDGKVVNSLSLFVVGGSIACFCL
jgi:hypothetical protein